MIDDKKIEAAKEEIYEDRFLLNGEEIVFNNDEKEEMFYEGDIKEAIGLGAKWAINEFLNDLNKLLHPASEVPRNDNGKILAFSKVNSNTSNPQPIGFSGILLAKRQNSFYCTYFLHNRNVADTKSPYPIKRLEVIRWFNQQSMVFNQSLS